METTNSLKGRSVVVAVFNNSGETFMEVWESVEGAERSVKEWMLERARTEGLAEKINTLGIYEAAGFLTDETQC
jgi:hypothetical protein